MRKVQIKKGVDASFHAFPLENAYFFVHFRAIEIQVHALFSEKESRSASLLR